MSNTKIVKATSKLINSDTPIPIPSLTPIFPGVIENKRAVTVTDENNCENSTEIVVDTFEAPQPQIEGSFELCLGDSIFLSVIDTFVEYEWSNAAVQFETEVFDIGDLSVIVTDQNGCMGTDTILISELPAPVFDILGEPSFCEGSSTTLSATLGF